MPFVSPGQFGWLTLGLATLAGVVAPRSAEAQVSCSTASVVVQPYVTRTNVVARAQNLNPTGINFSDCEANAVLNFSLALSGFCSDVHLQAWIGSTDCTPLLARSGMSPTCWPASGDNIASATSVSVSVRAQDIVAHEVDSVKPTTYVPATEAACHVQQSSGPVALSIYFIWLIGTGEPVGTAGKYDIKTALVGPGAPASVKAEIGDTALIVNWNPSRDSNTQGFNVYIDPPPGQETTSDAAPTSSDAGGTLVCKEAGVTDGGFDDSGDARPGIPIEAGCVYVTNSGGTDGSVGSSCSSTVLVSGGGTTTTDEAGVAMSSGGTQKIIDRKYLVPGSGETTLGGSTNTMYTIKGLKNGSSYTVAVAAVDGFANVGPLSVPSCQTPMLVDDFWKKYRGAGGEAGGGFCALEGAGMPAGSSVFGLGAAAALVSLVRRRRRRASGRTTK